MLLKTVVLLHPFIYTNFPITFHIGCLRTVSLSACRRFPVRAGSGRSRRGSLVVIMFHHRSGRQRRTLDWIDLVPRFSEFLNQFPLRRPRSWLLFIWERDIRISIDVISLDVAPTQKNSTSQPAASRYRYLRMAMIGH